MFDHDEIAERQAATARYMAERLNALAERVFVIAEAATEPEAVQAAALTVERLYRGVRLCMGYELRVVRDHRRALRDAEIDASAVYKAGQAKRAERIRYAVISAFRDEYEAALETSDDPDEVQRTYDHRMHALVEAITKVQDHLDPTANDTNDFDGEVAAVYETVLHNVRMRHIEADNAAATAAQRRARRSSG